MYTKNILPRLAFVACGALLFGLTGCSGATDGGDSASEDLGGSQFIAGDGTVGKISVVAPDAINVASTGGFTVSVTDASGAAVRDIKVSCDTEQGLAIIEPVTGVELTDRYGRISGVVGCETPGSYQIGCRLPIGANLRKFQTVHCSGTPPSGFTGFDGAGGGGLGGGSNTGSGGSGGSDADSGFALTSIVITDGPAEATSVIDTAASTANCSSGTEDELFGDSVVSFDAVNDGNQDIRLTNFTFRVGSTTYGPISITANGSSSSGSTSIIVGANGGTLTFTGVFGVALSNGTKLFAGSSTAMTAIGSTNVQFTVNGVTEDGQAVSQKLSAGLNFQNILRCS